MEVEDPVEDFPEEVVMVDHDHLVEAHHQEAQVVPLDSQDPQGLQQCPQTLLELVSKTPVKEPKDKALALVRL